MTTEARRHGGVDIEGVKQELEQRIAHWVGDGGHDQLSLAMRAGALGAGKRMRPLLTMLVARDLGCDSTALVDVACAVELVHAASLILDDLPCMDDARLRRGKPTIHIQFGEDVAILAGIALLSRAFHVLATADDIAPAVRARLVARLAETVGAQGLAKGQFLDLRGSQRSAADIDKTNELKTGVLLGVAVDMAAIIAQTDDCVAQSLRAFALAAGHAFQLRDDFLDLPGMDSAVTGKDTGLDLGKVTLLNALGHEGARARLAAHLIDADRHLTDALGSRQGEQHTRSFVAGLFRKAQVALPDGLPFMLPRIEPRADPHLRSAQPA
jgi:geranylgeranyl diphosphate synthase type II